MRIKILLDDLEEISYWDLERKSAISHFLENSLFGRVCGSVVRQTAWWWWFVLQGSKFYELCALVSFLQPVMWISETLDIVAFKWPSFVVLRYLCSVSYYRWIIHCNLVFIYVDTLAHFAVWVNSAFIAADKHISWTRWAQQQCHKQNCGIRVQKPLTLLWSWHTLWWNAAPFCVSALMQFHFYVPSNNGGYSLVK